MPGSNDPGELRGAGHGPGSSRVTLNLSVPVQLGLCRGLVGDQQLRRIG